MRTDQQRRDMPQLRNVLTGSRICPPDDVLHNARMPKDPMYFPSNISSEDGYMTQHPGCHQIRTAPLQQNGQAGDMDSAGLRSRQVLDGLLTKE